MARAIVWWQAALAEMEPLALRLEVKNKRRGGRLLLHRAPQGPNRWEPTSTGNR